MLVEAKRGPRGQGWWGAAIMAPRREPLLGVNVLGAGQPLCDQERQGSPSTAGTCGFRCSHRSGGGREREENLSSQVLPGIFTVKVMPPAKTLTLPSGKLPIHF